MTLPEGVAFQPPAQPNESSSDGIILNKPKPPKKPERLDENGKPQRTRVKPPPNALSLQYRLFYLLQPPLESWLAGQELIMPFEPFPYQYEGIAWMFARHSALLADEMGLGKTVQSVIVLFVA